MNNRFDKLNKKCVNKTSMNKKDSQYDINKLEESKFINTLEDCYESIDNSNLIISHFIITRYLIDITDDVGNQKIYSQEYIFNGIRVMKKYLLSSLENQKCQKFIWILMIGNNFSTTYVKSLLNFNNSFEYDIVNQNNMKNYIRNKTKNSDILITSRIDYDDRIYYDAINDLRKAINMEKPIIIHGYNKGFYFFEKDNKYYDYYRKVSVSSVLVSLILNLKKVNDTYTIYDMGPHTAITKNVLKKYKSYGIQSLDYVPFAFDSGASKFIKVIQKFSATQNFIKKDIKGLKPKDVNLNIFYKK